MTAVFDSIPTTAITQVKLYLSSWDVAVKVVSKRKTKHGDYRKTVSGAHQITINKGSNPYRFLITLIHELAHFVAFQEFGYQIQPHGKEWKMTFQKLMLPLINPTVFPESLLAVLELHFKNPKASSDTDFNLVMELSKFDPVTDKTYIFELNLGEAFVLPNERKFIRGQQRRKRFECVEISTQKKYLVSPHAAVQRLDRNGEKTMEN